MYFLRRPTTPWYEKMEWNQPRRQEFWNRQPRRQLFIDPEDYYDPLFGGQQQKQCNCRDCARRHNNKQQSLADEEKLLRLVKNNSKKPSEHFKRIYNESVNNEQDDIEPKEDSNFQRDNEEVKPIGDDVQSTTEKDNSREEEINEEDNPTILRKINNINEIKSDVKQLCKKVSNISLQSKEYEYLYLEEMLTKCLLKLDDILAEGEASIKKARKELVLEINRVLFELEQNRNLNEENDENKSSEEEILSEDGE